MTLGSGGLAEQMELGAFVGLTFSQWLKNGKSINTKSKDAHARTRS